MKQYFFQSLLRQIFNRHNNQAKPIVRSTMVRFRPTTFIQVDNTDQKILNFFSKKVAMIENDALLIL